MSVAQLSTTGLDKLFLEYIKPGLEIALYENTSVYDRFKTNTEDVKGKYGITKVLTSAPKSFRASSKPPRSPQPSRATTRNSSTT